jgi:hypothetical protein
MTQPHIDMVNTNKNTFCNSNNLDQYRLIPSYGFANDMKLKGMV